MRKLWDKFLLSDRVAESERPDGHTETAEIGDPTALAESLAFYKVLEAAGIDQVRLWYQRMSPQQEPRKFHWVEMWLAEQEKELRENEAKRISLHESITRWIAAVAIIVAFASCVVTALAWLHPRSPEPPSKSTGPSITGDKSSPRLSAILASAGHVYVVPERGFALHGRTPIRTTSPNATSVA